MATGWSVSPKPSSDATRSWSHKVRVARSRRKAFASTVVTIRSRGAGSGSGQGVPVAGTMISRGSRTVTSSTSASLPSLPTNSAAVNSPVERSISPTPWVAPSVVVAIRSAGVFASRYAASVKVPGETTRDDFASEELLLPAAAFPYRRGRGGLDLLAECDPIALGNQTRKIAVDRVIR